MGAGGRGGLFWFEGDGDDGFVIAVDDWARIQPTIEPGLILMADEVLRAKIVTVSRRYPIVFHDRCAYVGAALSTRVPHHVALTDHWPTCRDRPLIVLTARSSIYTLEHELSHANDIQSGFNDMVKDRLWTERERYDADHEIYY